MLERHVSPPGSITALAIALLLAISAAPSAAAAKTVWAVGDGADSGTNDDAVAAMIAQRGPDAFLYLGDVYNVGSASEFGLNYEPGFGRLRPITHPTPGNHEWDNRDEGYDPYWGPRFSAPHYYSFDLGGWHFISLNSEEAHEEGSAQLSWLRSELSERRGNCTIAYWHRPRYSAATVHGDERSLSSFWDLLASRATIVLTAHDHNYQRFKPIDGITNWVVGTGGHGHYGIDANDTRLAFYNATDYGALRLELSSGRADYAFVTTAGTVLDSGSIGCDRMRTPGSRPDTRPPRVTRVRTSWKRFRQGSRRSRTGSRRIRRLAIRYTLSERATVEVTIVRVSKSRITSLRRLTDNGQRGLNRKLFSGRIGGRPLRPGAYRAVIEATDRAGNISRPKTVGFRVLRARKLLP